MSDSYSRGEHADEVLDLYDVLPERADSARVARPTEDDPVTSMIKNTGRNLAAIIGMFTVSLIAFVVCTALFSLGLGLLVLFVGLFVLVACLVVAGWSSRMTMALLDYAGIALPRTRYPAPGSGLRGKLRRLAHPQSWRDLLHVLVNFILSVISFSLALTWVVGGLGGVTYWFWSQWLPEPSEQDGLAALLGYPSRFADITLNTVLGSLLLITAPFVLRGLVRLHGAVAYALLVDETPALRQQVSELTQSRTAAGEAEVHTLRRLERDLHDGPQQRLVRLGMDLSAAQRRLGDDPVQARALLDEALKQSQDALAEIRTLSRGIAPPILAEEGLQAAITALAARCSVPTSVEVEQVQLSDAAQNAAYFVVAEALANMEKHSQAHSASVEVRRVGALAVINITDDGVGGASSAKGHGLSGLVDRLAGVDGTLTVSSPQGGPTQLTATIPLHP
ncbi:MAG TPA: sensor histidine kinase [Propionibacteriaceae bacterium]|nr:sensor histidine kinase [Propionibacteriaceae bacterium]